MAKNISKKTKAKEVSPKKKNTNEASIFPILGIIVALTAMALFYYNDISQVFKAYITDQNEVKLIMESIGTVSASFVIINIVVLFIEWWLYKYNHKKLLYIVTIISFLLICNVLSAYLKVFFTPFVVGVYYSIKITKKS